MRGECTRQTRLPRARSPCLDGASRCRSMGEARSSAPGDGTAVLPKPSMKLALAAAVAGLVAGYLAHRNDQRARAFAVLQGFEWFVSAGGAALLADAVREALEDDHDLEVTERVVRMRQAIEERLPGQ